MKQRGFTLLEVLVATVIMSAVVPTAIANAYFMPRHLLPGAGSQSSIPMTTAKTKNEPAEPVEG